MSSDDGGAFKLCESAIVLNYSVSVCLNIPNSKDSFAFLSPH